MTRSVGDERPDLSRVENRAPSVAHLFVQRVLKTPAAEAFRFPRAASWESVTWAQTDERVRRMAAGLVALGVEPEQRVALASSTRIEWVLADLAVMLAGAATTTIYPTTSESDMTYIAQDSQSRIVFAEDDAQVAKFRANRAQLPDLVKVVTFDGTADGDWVISLADLEQLGSTHLAKAPTVVDERIDAIEPQHLATLIYTSGTTGRPKGVRLSHDCWTYEAAAVDAIGILTTADLQYLWLPLAHVFGKVLLTLPLQIGFPTVVDGRVDKIVENLAVVSPTFMGAAPRIFEKAYGRIVTMMTAEGGVKAKLFDWAIGVGRQVAVKRADGVGASGVLAVQHALADRLVLHKVRARFGGKIRFFISGSAALNRDVAQWFDATGMLILEGYGLTESSAASFVNRPDAYAFGSVGWAVPGTDVRIADDGEVLLKGPGIMSGYHDRPDDSAEAVDGDGWLHTGDIGNLDDRGFLRITDRKKDLFKTSGGKYVAPSAIESMFMGVCPYASALIVHGDGRNFVSALVTLDPDAMAGWAVENAMSGRPYAELVGSPEAREMVQGYIDALNARLNPWETIKKFLILPKDLSIEDGDLTPSMKLKRRVVAKKYKDELDSLYP
ncbi:MAG: AMP-dependent synthetase/ligase [Actinomycetota bacterium]|mgnify:CR=1 FL=1